MLPFLKVRTFCCARLPYRPRNLALADSSTRENNIVQGSLMAAPCCARLFREGNHVVPGSLTGSNHVVAGSPVVGYPVMPGLCCAQWQGSKSCLAPPHLRNHFVPPHTQSGTMLCCLWFSYDGEPLCAQLPLSGEPCCPYLPHVRNLAVPSFHTVRNHFFLPHGGEPCLEYLWPVI